MFTHRTLIAFLALLAAFAVLASPGLVWPAYLDSPIGLLVAVPYLSIYLFDSVGIPGLLQNDGACGWGWCSPSTFGWALLILFWAVVGWLVAWLVAVAIGKRT